ncbi:MAG: family 43 glycosylhydrolase [Acidobacteria bacterium]|nr:family 43 glycosylhydrolase [Acidobacteriota bacterium]
MKDATNQNHRATYINPVHPRACPDPYILKYRNEYWCYCTGIWHDGRCFGVLHSRDLLHWRELGGAMERLNPEATCYWAPEVSYDNGRFLMYYSVGNEATMHIRVAIADHPAGPFVDAGRRLTREEFAIDPHLFRDEDGTCYLFYATDFYQHTHIGTGTVCDRMLDWFTLAGEARPVSRARFDWQVYDPQRAEKGGVRWHTVEGPFVVKRKGIYYQMFSGGNWKNNTYGVSYATSNRVVSPDEWQQLADGERVLPILRTLPGLVIGPGHNCVVRGPDNSQMFCIYHRWADDYSDRVLAIDRMDWAGERMFIMGPTTTPQPAPNAATLTDFFDEPQAAGLGANWQCVSGQWAVKNQAAVQAAVAEKAEARCRLKAAHFIAEVHLRALPDAPPAGEYGVRLLEEDNAVVIFKLNVETRQATIAWRLSEPRSAHWVEQSFALPKSFRMEAYHLLHLEVNSALIKICLDDNAVRWHSRINGLPQALALWTHNTAAAFAGFALTCGWQDLFTESHSSPDKLGWEIKPDNGNWHIKAQQLWFAGSRSVPSILTKGSLPEDYEFVVNVKLCSPPNNGVGYGFLPALQNNFGPLLTVERQPSGGWAMRCDQFSQPCLIALPPTFDPYHDQQFRFRKVGGELSMQYEGQTLGSIQVAVAANRIGLFAAKAALAFDMVRVTAIK